MTPDGVLVTEVAPGERYGKRGGSGRPTPGVLAGGHGDGVACGSV